MEKSVPNGWCRFALAAAEVGCSWRRLPVLLVCGLLPLAAGCGQRMVAGPLHPVQEEAQQEAMSLLDDGTVLYEQNRFEVALRPVTDEELNRQFSTLTENGVNPYTYGSWRPTGAARPPARFTVFLLRVKNYAYPKVGVKPANARLRSPNGREYEPFSLTDLADYYTRYVTGYAGNRYTQFKQRKDLMRQTLFPKDLLLFSGQENKGYLVFPVLPKDVREVTIDVRGIVVRYNAWEEPVETLDLAFRFAREVLPIAPD